MDRIRHRNTNRRAGVGSPDTRRPPARRWWLDYRLGLVYLLILSLAGVPAAFAQTKPRPGRTAVSGRPDEGRAPSRAVPRASPSG